MKVTRVAYSANLNAGKFEQLAEQAQRLGAIRSKVWREYGSINGVGVKDRVIRDQWMADGTAQSFTVLANAWKETVRDAVADITANREAAKATVRKAVNRRTKDPAERKRLFTALKCDTWINDPYLCRLMRQHTKRGRNRTHNQIVVRSDQHRTFTLAEDGNMWLAVPGLKRRQQVRIPLNTTVTPTGTLRLILRGNRVEVHYTVDASEVKSSQRPCGDREIGVDKGYSEVLTDSDGQHHGTGLGELLASESDRRTVTNARRAKLRSIAEKAAERGDHTKAQRIRDNNLGVIKRQRRSTAWQRRVRDITFKAVHAVVNKACLVAAEDLTKTFTSRKQLGKNTNRRLAAWTKVSPLRRWQACRNAEVLRCGWSTLPTRHKSFPAPGLSGSGPGTGFTAQGAGPCGKPIMPLRSTCWSELPIPTSACTPRTRGCGRSFSNGLIANGPDCRARTPTPHRSVAVESESSETRSTLIKE